MPRFDVLPIREAGRNSEGGIAGSGCLNPGANPVSGNDGDSLSEIVVACGSGGITTANAWARVFTADQLGSAYTLRCIDFGVVNTGDPIAATIGVYIDPTGGAPQSAELELLQSYPLSIPNGMMQRLVVEGDPLCVSLEGSETLVVVLEVPASTTGFVSGRGGTAAVSPTFVRAAACSVNDFVNIAALGFQDIHWFVELSGDFGCDDGIVGDLNGDGVVDGADLAILLSAWGTADAVADLNGDGLVDGADLTILLGNWTPFLP